MAESVGTERDGEGSIVAVVDVFMDRGTGRGRRELTGLEGEATGVGTVEDRATGVGAVGVACWLSLPSVTLALGVMYTLLPSVTQEESLPPRLMSDTGVFTSMSLSASTSEKDSPRARLMVVV